MIQLRESIAVKRPIHEAFAYIADFRNTREWDATAYAGEKLTPGPVRVGTEFDIDCKLPIGSVRIRYTITRLEPNTLIELTGKCGLFEVVDLIALDEEAGTTRIEYQADFSFSSALKPMARAAKTGMERMGRKAVAGLEQALNDDFPAPAASSGTATADKLLFPGLAMFSRAGYTRGRKRWNPISAWLGDKHIVITGANAGLGLASAHRLAEMGARLTLVIRKQALAETLKQEIVDASGNSNVHIEIADLSLMSDVDALVTRLSDRGEAIDVLINNAGALFNPRQLTDEGLEQSFALLLLSPYRLTLGLKPLLAKAEQGRVINVVSGGMYSQALEVESLIMPAQGYSGSVAYARAKRALMVMTEEWAQAWEDDGIVVNAMHPGWADTPGVKSALPGFHRITRRILRSPEEGADTIVWLAAATEAGEASGQLFLDREPRTPYLVPSKREAAEQRDQLRTFLAEFDIGARCETAA